MRYSEPYALPSYNCYVYLFTSTDKSRGYGVDKFNDFTLAPTPSFWDYFGDSDNIYGWTVDWGGWQIQDEKLQTTQSHSMIHTDANFAENRHVKADVRTITAGSEDWQVAWLRAKWVDWNNQLYVGIKKNGHVELGIRSGGNQKGWANYTGLYPYTNHYIAVNIVETKVLVWVDGTLYLNITDSWVDNFNGKVVLDAHMSTARFDNIVVLDE